MGAGPDFDNTSIASISESSHWSGGAGDDLDNVALVNGSDTNTMENKDWCTYLKMAKNGYNSSEDENNNEDDEMGDNSSIGDANSISSRNNKASRSELRRANKKAAKPSEVAEKKAEPKQGKRSSLSHSEEKKISKRVSQESFKAREEESGAVQREPESDNEELSIEDEGFARDKGHKAVEEEDEDEDEDDDEDEDELDDDDIWTIKPKLYSYYEKQFKTMQPNINGFITGAVAKPFFERSKLPLSELSKIW